STTHPSDHGWASELLSLSALPTAPYLFLSRPAGLVLGVGHHFFCPGAPYAGPGLALHASWPLPHPSGLPGAPTSCAAGDPAAPEHLPQASGLCEGRQCARWSPRQRPSGRERQALRSWAQPPHDPSATRPEALSSLSERRAHRGGCACR